MAKIEVVIDGDQVPAGRDLFIEAGATGYTGVSGVCGFGHHGHHQGRLLFDGRASLSLLITVVPEIRSRRWSRASGAARGPARGLRRHQDPREPPPLLPLSDLPARVDGDLVGGRQHPDGGHGLQHVRWPGGGWTSTHSLISASPPYDAGKGLPQ